MIKCIFCKSETNSFDRVEHLIPESLGGEIVLPKGLVCDKCNEYFGRSVEQKALNTPSLSFMRTYLSIPNKHGKQRQHEGFRFNLFGQHGQLPSIELPPEKADYVLSTGQAQLLVPANLGVSSICRLLLKMGLEYLAVSRDYDVFDNQFDEARQAARFPKKGTKWGIALGQQKMSDFAIKGTDELGEFITETVYDISLALEHESNFIGVYFVYGWEKYIAPLNISNPNIFSEIVIRHNITNPSEEPFRLLTQDLTTSEQT